MLVLSDSRRSEIASLCRRFRVRRLDLFGSGARGTFDPESSDLDFVVEFEPLPPTAYADAYFGLWEGLAALFGLPVDLVTEAAIVNPYFRDSIAASRSTVYGT